VSSTLHYAEKSKDINQVSAIISQTPAAQSSISCTSSETLDYAAS